MFKRRMSAWGPKLKSNRPLPFSALTSTADIMHRGCEVRKVPQADVRRGTGENMIVDHLERGSSNVLTVFRYSLRLPSVGKGGLLFYPAFRDH